MKRMSDWSLRSASGLWMIDSRSFMSIRPNCAFGSGSRTYGNCCAHIGQRERKPPLACVIGWLGSLAGAGLAADCGAGCGGATGGVESVGGLGGAADGGVLPDGGSGVLLLINYHLLRNNPGTTAFIRRAREHVKPLAHPGA